MVPGKGDELDSALPPDERGWAVPSKVLFCAAILVVAVIVALAFHLRRRETERVSQLHATRERVQGIADHRERLAALAELAALHGVSDDREEKALAEWAADARDTLRIDDLLAEAGKTDGDPDGRVRAYDAAIAILKKRDNAKSRVMLVEAVGEKAKLLDAADDKVAAYREIVDFFRGNNRPWARNHTVRARAQKIHHAPPDPDKRRYIDDLIDRYGESGNPFVQGMVAYAWKELAESARDREGKLRFFNRVIDGFSEVRGEEARKNVGWSLCRRPEYAGSEEEAKRLYDEALERLRAKKPPIGQYYTASLRKRVRLAADAAEAFAVLTGELEASENAENPGRLAQLVVDF